jgi:hypothetical protein
MPMPDDDAACACATLDASAQAGVALVEMGSDRQDAIFAALERVANHGGDRWWLHSERCIACAAAWMVAQEERIYDAFLFRRLSPAEDAAITQNGRWPADFATYERVLTLCHVRSRPFTYLDPVSFLLVDAVTDLRRERPTITGAEIAALLGVSERQVRRLAARGLRRPSPLSGWWRWLFG